MSTAIVENLDKMEALVSVIIPTYNRRKLLQEAIESVRFQTYKNWELIVVDDGSEDDTEALFQSLRSDKISYHKISHSGIYGKVRNEGIKKANGKFIAFLDSDDIWGAGKLETQIRYLNDFPEAAFVFNNISFFGERETAAAPEFETFFHGDVLVPMLEEKRFVFYPSTLVFRSEILRSTGLIDESLTYTSDLSFFYNLCAAAKGIFLNERLVGIRRHGLNTTRDVPPEILLENIALVDSLRQRGFLRGSKAQQLISHYLYKMGLLQLGAKNCQSSMKTFLQYCKTKPLHLKGYIRLVQAGIQSLRD